MSGLAHPIRIRHWIGLGLLLLWLAPCSAAAPDWGYEVIAEYPHDPQAFTQGLLVSHGALLESTGQYGASDLRRVELQSGRTLAARPLSDRLFGEGLAQVRGQLYQLTWKAGRCLTYRADDLGPSGEFGYQGEGWGLASDGERLYMSDGGPTIQVRDPADFHLIRRIPVSDAGQPVTRLNELEWIQGLIWANVWMEPRIAIISPDSGLVVAWLDLGALVRRQGPGADVLNGIAYDSARGRVLITGKWWPRLYAIRVVMR